MPDESSRPVSPRVSVLLAVRDGEAYVRERGSLLLEMAGAGARERRPPVTLRAALRV